MKISYRLDYAEAVAQQNGKAWTLSRLVEGQLSQPAGLGPTRRAPAAAHQSGFVGSYSTLRDTIHAIAQDKAKWSSPPWEE